MYCRNCGKEVEDERVICADCEANLNTQKVNQGEKVEVVDEVTNSNPIVENTVNNNYNYAGNTNTQRAKVTIESKSKIVAGLLGIFVGGFGVHNFYLGYTGKAVAQLLISILSCGILAAVSSIWGLVEGILILTGEIKTDAKGIPLKDQ